MATWQKEVPMISLETGANVIFALIYAVSFESHGSSGLLSFQTGIASLSGPSEDDRLYLDTGTRCATNLLVLFIEIAEL